MLLRKMKLGNGKSGKSGRSRNKRSSRNKVGHREAVSASDYMGTIDGDRPAADEEAASNCSDDGVAQDHDSYTGAIEQLANACQAAVAAEVFAFEGVTPDLVTPSDSYRARSQRSDVEEHLSDIGNGGSAVSTVAERVAHRPLPIKAAWSTADGTQHGGSRLRRSGTKSLRSSLRMANRPQLTRNRLSESGSLFAGVLANGGNGEVPGQMEEQHCSSHRILVTGPSPLNPPPYATSPLPLPPISNVIEASPTFSRADKKQRKGGPLKPMVLNDVNNSI